MLKSSDFYNFKDSVALFKDMIDKSISDTEIYRRIKSGQLTPYLDYKGAAHLTKNGTVLRGIDYVSKLFEEEFYVSGVFKLSNENIILSEFCLEAILGVGNPVAQKIKIYSISNKNLKNKDLSLGYCLYNINDKINDKINEKHPKTGLKCEIVFDKEELLDIVSEYKNKQRNDYLENELEEAREYIERLKRSRNLLEIETSGLKKELNNQKNSSSNNDNNNTKSQDYKIIAMMAILLADTSAKFKHGDKLNMQAIERDIKNLVFDLDIDKSHLHGLDAPHKRISTCLKEFSQYFDKDVKN
ncbi:MULTISPECIES: hypothetical protein [unclassified Psychrobacter]|uniref:hypothetical protein n=1 Tax=unclassified Psychrobacter TaxID=196806 RepID=UPI00071478C6|nr:hypothetical protein [Psychrobacter sp. P11F6]KRG34823.1 hypothetical protein AK822_08305 [Psychrobacter sp. P11F6]